MEEVDRTKLLLTEVIAVERRPFNSEIAGRKIDLIS